MGLNETTEPQQEDLNATGRVSECGERAGSIEAWLMSPGLEMGQLKNHKGDGYQAKRWRGTDNKGYGKRSPSTLDPYGPRVEAAVSGADGYGKRGLDWPDSLPMTH